MQAIDMGRLSQRNWIRFLLTVGTLVDIASSNRNPSDCVVFSHLIGELEMFS